MQGVWFKPYRAAAGAALRFTKENICLQAEYSDVSFTPKKADISIRLIPYIAERNKETVNRTFFDDMPEYDGISILDKAYIESGYISFYVRDAFLLECAQRADYEFAAVLQPDIIELPESPEYAVMKLMNSAQIYSGFPFSPLNRRALWLCLGLADEVNGIILKRRLRAAAVSCISACNAADAFPGGVPAAAMAKLIAYAAGRLKNPRSDMGLKNPRSDTAERK